MEPLSPSSSSSFCSSFSSSSSTLSFLSPPGNLRGYGPLCCFSQDVTEQGDNAERQPAQRRRADSVGLFSHNLCGRLDFFQLGSQSWKTQGSLGNQHRAISITFTLKMLISMKVKLFCSFFFFFFEQTPQKRENTPSLLPPASFQEV